ncbi:ankyrin repeat-containing domain protein [Roridomyces roridus]|uniref:Ankyrin repeat-containing domain protein n=1 Tax=Roridomyces roridus TaxID=1738132 RepID=A0AAD7FZT2_9AGAR|nr:ankyrin repeat-containing domain protein [Roridomyces roridus]
MSTNYFDSVPPELIFLLSTSLSNASLNSFISTCHRFHEILQPELESRLTPALAKALLHWAAAAKPHIVAKLLAPPHSVCADHRQSNSQLFGPPTPLHLAVRARNLESAALLLEAGADPRQELELTCGESRQPLHLAALRSDLDMIELLLDHGAPIDSLSRPGGSATTVLHHFCTTGSLETVELLLSRGADLSVAGNRGPALGFVVHADHLPVVKYLLRNGADASVTVPLSVLLDFPPRSANLLYVAMGIPKPEIAFMRRQAGLEMQRWEGLPLDERRKQIMAHLLAHGCSKEDTMGTITMHLTALASGAGYGEEEFLQIVREMIKQAEDAIPTLVL